MNPYLNIATQAVRNGAKILLQSMDRIDRLTITEKSSHDFVSNVDIMSEAAIIEVLQKYYPDITILSEEAGEITGKDPEYRWVLDPLDGTSNYLRQIPHFSISLALQKNKKTMIALVYDPVKDELFTATKGGGAYCNNNRIRISNRNSLAESYIGFGGPRQHHAEHKAYYHNIATELMLNSSAIRRFGSAALDLSYLAAGRIDAYWGVNLNIWDIAAAILIAKEAGAILTNIAGQAFNDDNNIIAANPSLLHEIVSLCQPYIEE